ncbi:MAG TPA: hypothetical protein VMI92_06765 [Steroidobacteraceae bacterium]|nr:hypothetical protein [Steroidobacteraceae bacterium]
MDYPQLLIFAVFAVILGRFLYGRIKYGSWTGSFLKGKIQRTLGEVDLQKSFGSRQRLAVYAMTNEGTGEDFVGLSVSSRAALGASMQPYKLSKSQARELADLLSRAAS